MGFVIQIFGWPPNSSSVGEKKNPLLIGALLLLEAALFAFAWSHWFWVSWTILLPVGMGSIGYISLAPLGYNFPCRGRDSWVAIAVRSNTEWRRLCEVMDRPDLASDPRYSTLYGRTEHINQLEQAVEELTSDQEADTVTEKLQAVGIPSAPVANAAQVLENPQLNARAFFDDVTQSLTGTYRHAGTPWRLTHSPRKPRRPAPMLGQHSVQVFRNLLGIPEREIASLIYRGITGDTPEPEE